MHTLTSLFRPRSVAILGASARPEALGNTVLQNLLNVGFTGRIYPVHPIADTVLGLKCYADLTAIPEVVDCVVIALAHDKVMPALAQMRDAGIPSAVLFASGFAETGEAGTALQNELVAFCAAHAINVCGPNCLGLYSVSDGAALYSAALPEGLQPGHLALISQSGSACIALSNLDRLGFSHLVSLGNGAVTDIPEYLDYVAEDPATHVAALFVEDLRSPDEFARAARKMRAAGKPIIALKVGRSASGAAASAAHTGALATSDTALQAFFRRQGVVLVEDYDELVETSALFLTARNRRITGGLAILNVSGGELALACDLADRIGLDLPPLSATTEAKLRAILPVFASPRNPLDATGAAVFDTCMYGACLRALLDDPAIGLVAVALDCPASLGSAQAATYRALAAVVAQISATATKPVVFLNNLSSQIHPSVLEPLTKAGTPALCGLRNSLTAIAHFMSAAPALEPADLSLLIRQEPWADRLRQAAPFTESESKAFLKAHGIDVPREHLVNSADEAVDMAQTFGFPVVLKVQSPDLPHKSEVGGVLVGLDTPEAVADGYNAILRSVTCLAPNARLEGIVVQQMITGGHEAIVGVATHRPFGPGVAVGAGGVLVEILKDTAFALAPIDERQAALMLESTRFSRLLDGYRGAPVLDRKALARTVAKIADIALAYRDEIDAIDLNPVSVRPAGGGVVVLDALVIQKALADGNNAP